MIRLIVKLISCMSHVPVVLTPRELANVNEWKIMFCFSKTNITLVNVYVALPVFTPVAGSSYAYFMPNKMAAPSM